MCHLRDNKFQRNLNLGCWCPRLKYFKGYSILFVFTPDSFEVLACGQDMRKLDRMLHTAHSIKLKGENNRSGHKRWIVGHYAMILQFVEMFRSSYQADLVF